MKKHTHNRAFITRYFGFLLLSISCITILPHDNKQLYTLAETLLNNYDNNNVNTHVLMPEAKEELYITTGGYRTPDMHLHNSIKRTTTIWGDIEHKKLLGNPINHKEEIYYRQAYIRSLTDNAEILDNLSHLLSVISHHQENILMLWSTENSLTGRSDALSTASNLIGCSNNKYFTELLRYLLHKISGAVGIGLGSSTLYFCNQTCKEWYSEQSYLKSLGYTAISSAMFASWYYWIFPMNKKIEQTNKDMQKLLISVSATIHAAQGIATLLDREPHAYKALVHAQNLKQLTAETEELESQLAYVLKELNTSTFQKSEPTVFSWMGRVRVVYKLLNDVKNSLIPLMKAIGEVDAFVSPAKLIREYEDKPARFTFTEFVNAQDPLIKIEDSWNPVIRTEKVITENIQLGTGENLSPNILLTGPHGGGKSTLMRQVAYCVLLSQVFGIAPASNCIITPFRVINTYIDIRDNMQAGMSTFMAERERIDYIKKVILGLTPGRFALNIVDELFKGTMEEEASKLVTKFMERTEQVTESITLMASHFVQPAIEAETRKNSRFCNFHMDTDERTPGRFKRNFKLIKGRCDWWFNDIEKRNRYVKWLQTVMG